MLDRDLRGAGSRDDVREPVEDDREPLRDHTLAGDEDARIEDGEPAPLPRDDAVAAAPGAGIDAEDDHKSRLAFSELPSRWRRFAPPRPETGDRKSTRLNSS